MNQLIFDKNNINYDVIVESIKKGDLIIYPTDTVYGVGGALNLTSIEKIYKAKERNFTSPLIALVSNLDKIEQIAIIPEKFQEQANKLMKKFWPGGLTIIFEKKESIPNMMVADGKTVGIRMPDHPLALKIIEMVGGILPTTSANISGDKTPAAFSEISEKFKKRIKILVDDGKCPKGFESTIVDITGNEIKLLREGIISRNEIEKVIGKF
jgi:L-threonylcarbamoyladenylate synthase